MTLEKAKKIIKSECYIADLLDLDRTQTVNIALDTVIEAAEGARWIPVSEALPARDVSVLTYHRNESFDYQYVSWIDEYSGKWAGFIGNLSDEVLAWRELPQPYKAEGSDEE